MSLVTFENRRAEYLFSVCQELYLRLNIIPVAEGHFTSAVLEETQRELLTQYAKVEASKQPFFAYDVPEEVCRAILIASSDKLRVRIWMGDTTTGKCWQEEHDVVGTIGFSGGTLREPLLLANKRSMGGSVLLASNILRIDAITQRRTLYQHAKFSVESYEVVPGAGKGCEDYPFEVLSKVTRKVIARFKSELSALNWIGFMHGHRYAK